HQLLQQTPKMGSDFVSAAVGFFGSRGRDVCDRHLATGSAEACLAKCFTGWPFSAGLRCRGAGDRGLHQERDRRTEMGAGREGESTLADHGPRARAPTGGGSFAERAGAGCNGRATLESSGVVDCTSAAGGIGSGLRLARTETWLRSAHLWSAAAGGGLSRCRVQAPDSGAVASAVLARGAAADKHRGAELGTVARGAAGSGRRDPDCDGCFHARAASTPLHARRTGLPGAGIGELLKN